MTDLLKMDYINSLPQPFYVQFFGSESWWPVVSICVETGFMQLDACGKIFCECIGSVKSIKDQNFNLHDPETFYQEEIP